MKFWMALLLSVCVTIGFAPAPSTVALVESPSCVFISETAHNIHGAFLVFYRAHNGTENFGSPLTEAFLENGRIVQYFERARFEYFPEEPDPYRVHLGLLGDQYGITDPPIRSQAIPPANNPNFRYFPDSGQMISFAIKEYFDKSGGSEVLGYPISGLRFETGRFVQYFQRQRVAWDPAVSGANKVRPSPVGQLVLDRKYPADLKWRARTANDWCGSTPTGPVPTPQPFAVPTVTGNNTTLSLQVRVRFRQTGLTGPQYVDITVEDQNGKRMPKVALSATILAAKGERYFPLLPTNNSGTSAFSFEIGNQPPNSIVTVEVSAVSGTWTASGRDSFACH